MKLITRPANGHSSLFYFSTQDLEETTSVQRQYSPFNPHLESYLPYFYLGRCVSSLSLMLTTPFGHSHIEKRPVISQTSQGLSLLLSSIVYRSLYELGKYHTHTTPDMTALPTLHRRRRRVLDGYYPSPSIPRGATWCGSR